MARFLLIAIPIFLILNIVAVVALAAICAAGYAYRGHRELMRQHPGAAGLEWRGSYFAYLLTYWSALPIAECKQAR